MNLSLWLFSLLASLARGQDQTESEEVKKDEVDDQPSWVAEITRQLHPQLEDYLESQVKEALEAKIGSTLSSVMNKVIGPFRFSTFNVSGLGLTMDRIKVLELDHGQADPHKRFKPIKMDISL